MRKDCPGDIYLTQLMRRANLDLFWSREKSTITHQFNKVQEIIKRNVKLEPAMLESVSSSQEPSGRGRQWDGRSHDDAREIKRKGQEC